MALDMSKMARGKWDDEDIVGAEDYDGPTVDLPYERIVHVTYDGDCERGAVKFSFDGVKQWVPKAVIVEHEDGAIAVKERWAREKGWC